MAEDAKKKLEEQLKRLLEAKKAAQATGKSLKEQAAKEESEQEETGESQPG